MFNIENHIIFLIFIEFKKLMRKICKSFCHLPENWTKMSETSKAVLFWILKVLLFFYFGWNDLINALDLLFGTLNMYNKGWLDFSNPSKNSGIINYLGLFKFMCARKIPWLSFVNLVGIHQKSWSKPTDLLKDIA